MYTSLRDQSQRELFRGIHLKLTERTGAPQEINPGMEKGDRWWVEPMYAVSGVLGTRAKKSTVTTKRDSKPDTYT